MLDDSLQTFHSDIEQQSDHISLVQMGANLNLGLKHFYPSLFYPNLHLTLKDKPAWNSVVSLFQKQQ
jgi:hypothetical protein